MVTASSSDSSIKRSSGSGASLKHAAMMVNDNKADVSCTVPVFAGNEADPFPGIWEWKMTGIPRHPGNGSPGMHSLISREFGNGK